MCKIKNNNEARSEEILDLVVLGIEDEPMQTFRSRIATLVLLLRSGGLGVGVSGGDFSILLLGNGRWWRWRRFLNQRNFMFFFSFFWIFVSGLWLGWGTNKLMTFNLLPRIARQLWWPNLCNYVLLFSLTWAR